MDSSGLIIFNIFLVFFLVFLNAFFVVSEFSIVKIRRTRLEELSRAGNKKATLALGIHSHMDSYLSACQLGITLASLGLGWIGEPAIARVLENAFASYFEGRQALLRGVSFGIAFGTITLMHVVAGELIPKSLAIQKTEAFVLFIAGPLSVFKKIFHPVIWVFDHLAIRALRLMDVKPASDQEMAHSEEEIKMIVAASLHGGVIDQTESEIIKNAVDFSDTVAREVMVPRQDMKCILLDSTYDEILSMIKKTRHTRYPVCDGDKDNIVGMVHLRDLLLAEEKNGEALLKGVLRDVLFVPEALSISEILQRMKHRHLHMAVIVDEYGGTSGLLSIEDIIEELVGEIQDEHDLAGESRVKDLGNGSFEFDGMVLVEDAFGMLGLAAEESDEDTLGGYVFSLIGHRPKVGDIVRDDNCTFEVLTIERLRIKRLKASLRQKHIEDAGRS